VFTRGMQEVRGAVQLGWGRANFCRVAGADAPGAGVERCFGGTPPGELVV